MNKKISITMFSLCTLVILHLHLNVYAGYFIENDRLDSISPTAPNWAIQSDQLSSGFGRVVANAGDVNGDGFDDVIIGAPFYDNPQTNEGKVYVYYGSASGLSTLSNWSAEGNLAEVAFGSSVSSAGDVNNDGYDDVIIGTNGKVFGYYGSALGLSVIANWVVISPQLYSYFGSSVSGAGDVNQDGFDDVIIGAPLYDNGQVDEGRAFVYYGSPSGLSLIENWTMECNQASAFFGISVATAGDVNNDRYSDVIIGANRYDNPQRDQGAAFVYLGSTKGLSQRYDWKSESINSFFSYFGNSVSSAGDANGDGFSDIIIGAYALDNGQTDEGKVFLYNGSPKGPSVSPDWTAEGNQDFARFGYSVSKAGDMNNDGYSDIFIGANFYDDPEHNEGSGFLYYGSPNGFISLPNSKTESDQANSYFGVSVSYAGDINNDGFSDVIAGADLYDNVLVDVGGAFAYYGSWKGTKTLSLNVFIEGLYNDATNMSIRDTGFVYLRSSSSPYNLVDSSKAFLNSSGSCSVPFMMAQNGICYYIIVKHRNSIETWSKLCRIFTDNFLSYDFTSSQSKAFGNNLILKGTEWCIYSGDVNNDGIIDINDNSLVDNDVFNLSGGYVTTDINGDEFVDVSDMSIVDNNNFNYVSVLRP
ncbi:MAG: FG-GAP-like repeat-containing protein [Bacteroidota bacterium]|nr:FG-GAP-like repeat-containing protein [Bacteroidota bacterium]